MTDGSKFFSVMVVGDNPYEMMKKYDLNLKVEPYIKYKYKDAKKLKANAIKVLSQIINDADKFTLSDFQVDYFKDKVKSLNNMDYFEYYQTITNGLYYDENGNALSEENPNGKWTTFNLGDHFSVPLKTMDGKEVYQCHKKDVDWTQMHMHDMYTYDIVWDLVHNNRTPRTEEEANIYNNMKDKENYFSNFKDKDNYVAYNCSYWNYAYLDENGWKDMDDEGKEMEWITTFYETFVEPLDDNSTITIFECSKK